MFTKTFTITFDTGNAAFADDPAIEIVRILREVADRIENCARFPDYVYDLNGNHIGEIINN